MGTLPTFCIAPALDPPRRDFVGVYRPSDATFHLLDDIKPGPDTHAFQFGPIGAYPVAGDWDGDGIDSVGVYNQNNGAFQLTNTTSAGATTDYSFTFGNPGDIPIAGRWSVAAHHDGVGVFRPSNGLIFLKNELTTGYADMSMLYGSPGDVPIAGNWRDEIKYGDGLGIYRPSGSVFYLENDICNCQTFSDYNLTFGAGLPSPKPIAGDWTRIGHAGVGIFNSTDAEFNLRTALTTGSPDYIFPFGISGDLPIVGHWDDVCPAPFGAVIQPASGPISCNLLQPTVTPSSVPTSTPTLRPTFATKPPSPTPGTPCPWGGTPNASGNCNYTYDRAAAVQYAKTYETNASTLFCRYQYPGPGVQCSNSEFNTDCSNFVSQAVLYGGIAMTTNPLTSNDPQIQLQLNLRRWYCRLITSNVCQQDSSVENWAGAYSGELPAYLNNLPGTPNSQTIGTSTAYASIYIDKLDTIPKQPPIFPIRSSDQPNIETASLNLHNNGLQQGDVLFTEISVTTPGGYLPHTALVVGWGPYLASWYEGVLQMTTIYATYEDARDPNKGNIPNPVPYIVDHGPAGVWNRDSFLRQRGNALPRPYYFLWWVPPNHLASDDPNQNDTHLNNAGPVQFAFVKIPNVINLPANPVITNTSYTLLEAPYTKSDLLNKGH